ncbi:hypothetical protein GYA13_05200 [Candidatus Kuenenbacteria bacterium]|nr:hypothetical protein [Candidatus Kuenenbacteria bacterium]
MFGELGSEPNPACQRLMPQAMAGRREAGSRPSEWKRARVVTESRNPCPRADPVERPDMNQNQPNLTGS